MKHFLLFSFLFLSSFAFAEKEFKEGYPTNRSALQFRDQADFQNAVTAYRFWYPTVSAEGIFRGIRDGGTKENEIFYLQAKPAVLAFTPNVDTPYAVGVLDLKDGPLVIDVPAGPFIGAIDDHHQGWITDLGIPGVYGDKGGKHLILPPGFKGTVPEGYSVSKSKSNKILFALRVLPKDGNVDEAMKRFPQVKIYAYADRDKPKPFKITHYTPDRGDFTPLRWEDNFAFWTELKKVIDDEPIVEAFRPMYGTLAAIGIEKGKTFKPDARIKKVLEKAAKAGRSQMLVSAFASSRKDRMVWGDRNWEWVSFVSENGDFTTPSGMDLVARDRWFIQAILASPAMFQRKEGAGSLYWLGLNDQKGAYLDGSKTYKLSVPGPVPAKLFWSVTLYDTRTRSLIETDQNKPALRSLFELKNLNTASYDLYFGPRAPRGKEKQWIKTTSGKGWFAYFRIYGPEKAVFDGSWRPGDFEEIGVGQTVSSK